MSFLSVSQNALLLPRGRQSNNKRMINEESMECSSILVSSSHHSSLHSALLAGSSGHNSGHYGVKESKECDIMASDVDSTSDGSSRSKSDSSSSGSASLSSVSSPSRTKDRVWMVAGCSLIVCLSSLLSGMMLGFSSPALTQLQLNVTEEFRITHKDVKFSLFAVSSYGYSIAHIK